MANNSLKPFCKWLQIELVNRDMLQKELAVEIGATDQAVSRWINGHRFPREKHLKRILDLFNCHIEIVKDGGTQDGK